MRVQRGGVPRDWPEGDGFVIKGVSLGSALDPALLDVTCAECLAIVNRELKEG